MLEGGLTPQGLLSRAGLSKEVKALALLPGGALHLRVPPGQERAKAEALLRAGARYVQPNYLYHLLAQPNDPGYPHQRPFFRLIHMEQAWDRFASGYTPTVAVLDTAFDPDDPELASNLLPGFNATPDGLSGPKALDPSPPPSGASYQSGEADHGQGVAGLIAAVTDNGSLVTGVGWNQVKVLPIKVFYFVGSQYTSTTEVLARAIRYAADGGADVINLSLGTPGEDGLLGGAISYALDKGTVVVAAAGNYGTDGLLYPARHPGVIAAGSVRLNGTRSDFSNCSSPISDLVMAPGGNGNSESIMSLALGKDYGYYKGLGPFASWSGTSLSAPQVAGVAAMYIAQYRARYGKTPNLDQVRTCLTMTASNGRRYDPETGWGIIRADQVLEDTTYCFP
ncbi:MAG: S8 family serine peptidase [Thermaceae bacterium]